MRRLQLFLQVGNILLVLLDERVGIAEPGTDPLRLGLVVELALDRLAGQVLAVLAERELGTALPFSGVVLEVLEVTLQADPLGDHLGSRGFDLGQCVFHFVDHETNHHFGVFGPFQHRGDVGIDDFTQSRKDTHDGPPHRQFAPMCCKIAANSQVICIQELEYRLVVGRCRFAPTGGRSRIFLAPHVAQRFGMTVPR